MTRPRARARACAWLAGILAAIPFPMRAAADSAEDTEDAGATEEDGDRAAASVTSTRLTRRELDHRPHLRPRDLLRHVPGLVAIVRGGATTQLLARGLDAGQGAELEVTVDGVPINLGSHAFSHGHADTQFMIADTVASLALHEGNYAAWQGELATAGSLELRTLDEVPGGGAAVRLTSGLEPTQSLRSRLRRLRYQLVGMVSPELRRGSALLAAEVGIDDGPFVHPQRFRRGVLFGKWKRPVGDGTLTAVVQLYSGRWFDSGSLPAGEIAAGRLTPFSAPDPTQGGIAMRGSASVAYEVRDRRGATWHVSAYAVASELRLYDNPTLFLRDADSGSALEYVDRRSYHGAQGFYSRAHAVGPLRARLRVGVQARSDGAEATTWHVERRLRLTDCFEAVNPCTDTGLRTADLAVHAEETIRIGRRLRVLAGLRQSQHTWNVDDRDADTMLGPTTLGGTGARARIDPKLGVTYAGRHVDLVLLAAAGHHGSDARAAVDTSTYGAYVRTYGAELGARVRPDDRIAGAIALWASQLEASQAWAADAGASYRVPESRRRGIEARLAATPAAWLTLDAALGVARGSGGPADGAAGSLPLAPRIAGTAGIALHGASSLVSARVRALGPRTTTDPAIVARGFTLIDVIASRRWRSFELGASIENLLDARWYESQLAGDVRASRRVEPTRDRLVTPGAPLTVMLTLGYVP
jgi:hypothetical protein